MGGCAVTEDDDDDEAMRRGVWLRDHVAWRVAGTVALLTVRARDGLARSAIVICKSSELD